MRTDIVRLTAPLGLEVIPSVSDSGEGVWLLTPNADFWPRFVASVEYGDGEADPMDRYSKRVLAPIATALDLRAAFPSDGPPYPAFIRWALASEQIFQSPSGLLVHNQFGLWISFRGALIGGEPKVEPATRPCDTCPQPCMTACPVGAMSVDGYDFVASRNYVRSGDVPCWNGCLARQACIKNNVARDPKQSRFHMRSFAGQ